MRRDFEQISHCLVKFVIAAVDTSGSEIAIRALHKEVGDIIIRSVDGELDLEIGSHLHQHFGPAES